MSKALVEKILRAREQRVEVGGRAYTIRRPTDADALALRDSTALEVVSRHVVGWSVREADLVPGGSDAEVPFSAEVWAAWLPDQPDLWEPLATAIFDAYAAHVKAREDAAKN